jgi:ABC-type lipoprotein export system ATPase subunit
MTTNKQTDDAQPAITPEGVNDPTDETAQTDPDAVPYSVVFDDEAMAVFDVNHDDGQTATPADEQTSSEPDSEPVEAPTDTAHRSKADKSDGSAAANAKHVNETLNLAQTSENKPTDHPSADAEPATALSSELDRATENVILLKPNPLFAFNHVTYINGKTGRTVLDNLQWDFFPEKLYAVTEADDEQRRVFLALAGGFARSDRGQVMARSRSIAELEVREIRAHHIGLIPQRHALRPDLDAQGNLVFAMRASGRTFLKPLPVVARDLLKTVGFDQAATGMSAADLKPLNQRRLAIARAISCEAPILVADDPAHGLDAEERKTIFDLLAKLAHSQDPKRCVIMLVPGVGADGTPSEAVDDYGNAADEIFTF